GLKMYLQTGWPRFLRRKCRRCAGTALTDLRSTRFQACREPMLLMPVGSARRCPASPAYLVRIRSSLPDYVTPQLGMISITSKVRAVNSSQNGWEIGSSSKVCCRELRLV